MDRISFDCRLTVADYPDFYSQYANCPLIEVQTPHGRLIDADFEEAHWTSMTVNPTPDVTAEDKRKSLVVIEALQMAGTVIPAERSE